jgi:hypothetical protein
VVEVTFAPEANRKALLLEQALQNSPALDLPEPGMPSRRMSLDVIDRSSG